MPYLQQRHIYVQNETSQVPSTWKTRKLKYLFILLQKAFKFHLKEIQKSFKDEKEWVDSSKIQDQACNKSFEKLFLQAVRSR